MCYWPFSNTAAFTVPSPSPLPLLPAVVTRNLNKIIDINFYPVEAARRSNMRHRPIGIGVQGMADTFLLLGMPFDSEVSGASTEHHWSACLPAACRPRRSA